MCNTYSYFSVFLAASQRFVLTLDRVLSVVRARAEKQEREDREDLIVSMYGQLRTAGITLMNSDDICDFMSKARVDEARAVPRWGGVHFAYKPLNHTELHINHYKIRNICSVLVLFSALTCKDSVRELSMRVNDLTILLHT